MAKLRRNSERRVCLTIFLSAAIFLLAACGEKTIATTDNEFEANRMFDILYSNELPVEKIPQPGEKKGWEIVIDEGWFGAEEASVATQVLNDYGLPRPKETLPETTNPYGMPSEQEMKKRQNREKEIQIEQHLYDLPGVTKVGVLIGQPDNDALSALSGNKPLPTASVLIVQKEQPAKFTDDDVRSQVSGTVNDLKPENIHITTTYQPLREVPLERLAAQRRSNKIYALGGGLIVILLSALGVIWYALKRRGKHVGELDAGRFDDALPELSDINRPALEETENQF